MAQQDTPTKPEGLQVLREAPRLIAAIGGLRLRLLHLRAQIVILSLQRPDPLSQQGQVLTQNRRRAVLADQRLQLVEQRFKHFVCLRDVTADHVTAESA